LNASELLEQARELGYGDARASLAAEAVRLAGAEGNELLEYQARYELLETATFSGLADQALVQFAWCLAYSDRDKTRQSEWHVLWAFKWVCTMMLEFPSIPRSRLTDTCEEMRARYERYGGGQRALHYHRATIARHLGELDRWHEEIRLWRAARRDSLSDCRACESGHWVKYLIDRGEEPGALKEGRALQLGKLRCECEPESTQSALLAPLWRAGRPDEAVDLQRRAYRKVGRNREFLSESADHLAFLTRSGDLARAKKLFERHLPWALASRESIGRLRFFHSARLFLGSLSRRQRRFRLPRGFPVEDPRELRSWFDGQARALSEEFDRRNENSFFSRAVESAYAL
jgi:hypothetical protein